MVFTYSIIIVLKKAIWLYISLVLFYILYIIIMNKPNLSNLSKEDAIKKVKDYRAWLYLRWWKGWINTAISDIYDNIVQQIEQDIISPQQASERVDESQLYRYLNSKWRFS